MFNFVYLLQNIEAAFNLCHSVMFSTAAHGTRQTQFNVSAQNIFETQSDPRQRHSTHNTETAFTAFLRC